MGQVINVIIRNRVATNPREHSNAYICGNSGFVVVFDFDDEWAEYNTKTARFKYNDEYQDVVFEGNQVEVPVIENTSKIQVGVFAGNLYVTTPANIMAKPSILRGSGSPAAPSVDVYNQIMDLLNKGGASAEQIQGAVQDYLEKNPPQGVSDEHIREVTVALLNEAKESGEFDGKDGEDGITPHIGGNGNWYIGKTDTGVKAKGEPGEDGADYVLTEVDKEEIAGIAIRLFPIYQGEVENV